MIALAPDMLEEGGGSTTQVLVVDDQELMAEVTGRWLRRHSDLSFAGWMPTPAGLRERVQTLAEHGPVTLVIDWNIPGWSVEEQIPRLRAEFPDVRIVLCTADARGPEAARRVGADACVDKSQGPDALLTAVRHASKR